MAHGTVTTNLENTPLWICEEPGSNVEVIRTHGNFL